MGSESEMAQQNHIVNTKKIPERIMNRISHKVILKMPEAAIIEREKAVCPRNINGKA